MQESDPPYLTVGTEVSAKYKGAFCEAKIRKVVRVVKCKVTFKSGLGSVLLSDDQIKGSLRIGANVEARHPDRNAYIDAVINKIQDCSQYTVVFDDGDITTLRRSALCLKSGRHFNESDTLDHLPLTHPEHFSNPVVGGRRNVRRRRDALSGELVEGEESSDEESSVSIKKTQKRFNQDDGDVDIGKVVCVEVTDKKKGKDNWFPGVIVSPVSQVTVKIKTKDEYLVRSFRDGRYYTVPKKEITSFSKDSHGVKNDTNSNMLKAAIERAVQFIDKNELPQHWDKDNLFSAVDEPMEEPSEDAEAAESEESEEDTQAEEKDLFVAKLYKYMEERGTPINKVPVVCNRDLDLHKLYKVVIGRGGYNKVTNSSQWKSVTVKMGFGSMPSTSTINLVKQGYKKFIHNFEEFTRKLGCNFPVGSSSTSARSNRIMFRDRHASSSSTRDSKKEEPKFIPKEAKEEAVIAEVAELVPPPPLPTPPPHPLPAPVEEVEVRKPEVLEDPPRRARSRQESRQRNKEEEEAQEKERTEKSLTPTKKRRTTATKEKEDKEPQTTPQTTAELPPPSSPTPPLSISPPKRMSGRGKYKRKAEKEEVPEPVLAPEEYPPGREFIGKDVQVQMGDKLSVYYGKESEGKKYEAKVVDIKEKQGLFFVHYAGWNNRYDEWIPRYRVAENLSLRTEQVTSVPQGRGPSQSSTSDGTVSDSGTFKGPATGKGVKKKLKPSSPSLNTTRSKTADTPRKRLSSEGDATTSKRHTRKRGVLSGGESGGDSSESEEKTKSPKRVRKPKKIYDPGAVDWSKRVPSPDILDFSKETKEKPEEVIDLNKLRLEMKGIDKMVKISLPNTLPTQKPTPTVVGEEKSDVYDFKEDVTPNKDEGEAKDEVTSMGVEKKASTESEPESPVAPVETKNNETTPKEPPVTSPENVEVEKKIVEIPPVTEAPAVEISSHEGSDKAGGGFLPESETVTALPPVLERPMMLPNTAVRIESPIPPPPLVPRPPPPALIRATAPIPIVLTTPPIRTTTPITISVPQRAQRPILIKGPTPTPAVVLPSANVLPPQREQIPPQHPFTTASKAVPEKELPQKIVVTPKITTEEHRLISDQVVGSGSSPIVTLITTTTTPFRPKLSEGPKLASYPTARIRAASGILPIRPSHGASSFAALNVPLPSGSIKKRRKVKSQKFIESSESSDEGSDPKQKRRHVYAPKTSFKQVSLQVTQTPPVTRLLVPGAGSSSTVAATVASVSSNLTPPPLLIPKTAQIPVPKVVPIVKAQLAMEKGPASPGNKIVSGKYTRVEQPMKILKKTTYVPIPVLKVLPGIPKQQSVIVKNVQSTATPLRGESQSQQPHSMASETKEGFRETGPLRAPSSTSSQVPAPIPNISESATRQEEFVPFRRSMEGQSAFTRDNTKAEVCKESEDEHTKGSGVEIKIGEMGKEKTKVASPSVPAGEIPIPEEESCHSLLCEEEIPGSPTPGSELKSFSFDYSNPTEFPLLKTALPVGRAESVINQSVFSVIVPNKPPEKVQIQTSHLPATEKSRPGLKPSHISTQAAIPPTLVQIPERGAFSAVSAPPYQPETQLQEKEITPLKYPSEGEDNQNENSPHPMSTSSSISTGSPRGGDGEPHSASGENSKSKEPSDTDSIDCLPKSGDIADENSSSDEGGQKYGRDRDLVYERCSSDRGMRRSRSPSSSPRKRRMVRRDSPDESPPRPYRGSHRSSIRRLDADYGRMPPPQPPVNLGKPPRSDKYNFIPELSDDMTSEERVEIVHASMAALREKYKELKTELSFYDRKKKRIRKREREREKREKEAAAAAKPTATSTTALA